MEILISHPSIGSAWLSHAKIENGYVIGDVWDDSQCGSGYYPDDYMGEWFTVNFPVSCIRRIECETCRGRGYIRGERDYDHNDMPIEDLENCSHCNGKGFLQKENI